VRYAELHRFAAKSPQTVENDREKIFDEWRALPSRARVEWSERCSLGF
jgi:hypothetical protein